MSNESQTISIGKAFLIGALILVAVVRLDHSRAESIQPAEPLGRTGCHHYVWSGIRRTIWPRPRKCGLAPLSDLWSLISLGTSPLL